MPVMKKVKEIFIKPMTKDDVEAVVEIEKEAYGKHHWAKSSFYDEMSNNLARYYAVKTLNGELVGYAGTWHIIDEGHITTIAVKNDYLRNHIGEAIIHSIIEDCYKDGVKYLTLEVRVSNTPAIKLYEKYGFQSLGTRKGYYQDNNEDALIMWTENIFYDKFKSLYIKNIEKLKTLIDIKYE
ncbi:ribosomal protein S18-alanine N-acetyltransferase [bacterium]|nr:ribosomal protein S18-alanine N-acetyltransferase [bacterium]